MAFCAVWAVLRAVLRAGRWAVVRVGLRGVRRVGRRVGRRAVRRAEPRWSGIYAAFYLAVVPLACQVDALELCTFSRLCCRADPVAQSGWRLYLHPPAPAR